MVIPNLFLLPARLLAAALPLAAAPLAAAEGPFDLQLAPGAADERCLRLTAGARLGYEFAADAPVEFNIHHHRGKEVLYPVQQPATRGGRAQLFRADTPDDYCLMWENRGAGPVRVRGHVQRLP